MQSVSGLVLAAGGSSRFGAENKLLASLGGRPLIEHALAAMAGTELSSVVCALGADADEVAETVDLQGAIPVVCSDWAEGQSASLREGINALDGSDAVVVTLGDQPFIAAAAIEKVVVNRQSGILIIQATYGGVPGHPVVLERELFPRLRKLRGDQGARQLIAQVGAKQVKCDGLGSPRDIDTFAELGEVTELMHAPRNS